MGKTILKEIWIQNHTLPMCDHILRAGSRKGQKCGRVKCSYHEKNPDAVPRSLIYLPRLKAYITHVIYWQFKMDFEPITYRPVCDDLEVDSEDEDFEVDDYESEKFEHSEAHWMWLDDYNDRTEKWEEGGEVGEEPESGMDPDYFGKKKPAPFPFAFPITWDTIVFPAFKKLVLTTDTRMDGLFEKIKERMPKRLRWEVSNPRGVTLFNLVEGLHRIKPQMDRNPNFYPEFKPVVNGKTLEMEVKFGWAT